jgi:hypothetical protein
MKTERRGRVFLQVAALSLAGVLVACTKLFNNAPSQLPPYIHKIAVHPFTNHTQQYGLEDKLTLAVQSELNRDGRYQITSENQADGVVSGDITRYTLEALSYDSNHVPTEYRLWILVNVSFEDKVKGQLIWNEPEMLGELRYYVSTSGFAGSMTEDEARQTIWDTLSRDIRTRAIEGIRSSSKESGGTPGTSTSTYTAPPQDNNPPPLPNAKPSAPSPTRLPY